MQPEREVSHVFTSPRNTPPTVGLQPAIIRSLLGILGVDIDGCKEAGDEARKSKRESARARGRLAGFQSLEGAEGNGRSRGRRRSVSPIGGCTSLLMLCTTDCNLYFSGFCSCQKSSSFSSISDSMHINK